MMMQIKIKKITFNILSVLTLTLFAFACKSTKNNTQQSNNTSTTQTNTPRVTKPPIQDSVNKTAPRKLENK